METSPAAGPAPPPFHAARAAGAGQAARRGGSLGSHLLTATHPPHRNFPHCVSTLILGSRPRWYSTSINPETTAAPARHLQQFPTLLLLLVLLFVDMAAVLMPRGGRGR